MELISDKMQVLLRLALCGGGAAVLYAGVAKLPALEEHRPWLEEHRLQVIALGTAALFGLSLLAFPRPEHREAEEAPDGCDGYEPVESVI